MNTLTETEHFKLTISHGQLIMTFAPSDLVVCDECPDLHFVVLTVASVQNLRDLAAGIVHLSTHVDDGH